MIKLTLVSLVPLTFLLLPFVFATADQSEQSAVPRSGPQIRMIDKGDIPLEDLAHSFFFHRADSRILTDIVSEDGINRIRPDLAELRRAMTDIQQIAPKLRRLCNALQNAKSGQEFAAVFVAAEETEQRERRAGTRRILSKLDAYDRDALVLYLDTTYRQVSGQGKVDSEAMFASGPFPSSESSLVMQRTCDAAVQMEERIAP